MLFQYDADMIDRVKSGDPMLLDFYANWCGPCKTISPTIDQIAELYPDLVVIKINVDDYPDMADEFDVSSIPTLIFKKGDEIKDTSIGVVPLSVLETKIKILLGT